ncbi:hypothetical protein GINT2_002033 [Glugoides intestinalis]
MKLKYLSKEYVINLEDLPEKNIGCLKDKIRELISRPDNLNDDKIMIFHNKVKLPDNQIMLLNDESIKVNDESTLFIVIISGAPVKQEEKKQEARSTQPSQHAQPENMMNQGMFGYPTQNMGMGSPNMYMGDMGGMEKQLFEQMLNNPDAVMQMMETQMPGVSEDQKRMIRQNLEIIRQNPDLVKQMLNNPMMMNAMRNPMMGAQQMNSPMMGGVPPMNSPMMGYNPYMMGYNPYMMGYNPQMAMNQAPTPANGPCSHGFYPPKYNNGVAEPQDARVVWAEKLVSLKEMGFSDEAENISALIKKGGNISEAIDYLTEKHNQHSK